MSLEVGSNVSKTGVILSVLSALLLRNQDVNS